jgi:DNA topoisomerase-2
VKDILVSLLNPPNAPKSDKGGKRKAPEKGAKKSPTRRSKALSAAFGDEPVIKDYAEYHTDTTVCFKIKFDSDVLTQLLVEDTKTGITELEKLLHLTSRISCDKKLNLYDETMKLKTYSCVEDILEHYYKLRIDYYGRRKAFMIPKMEEELLFLATRVRFILDVIAKKIRVNDRTKANITEQLEAADYPKMFEKKLMYIKDMTEVQRVAGNYDFLVGMPIYSLTRDRIEELKKEQDELEARLAILRAKSIFDLWSDDLQEFEKEYGHFMKEYYESIGLSADDFPNTTNKASRIVNMKKKTA